MTIKQITATLKKQGRKKEWLAKQLDMHRKTLWLKIKKNSLSDEEKEKIKNILALK